MTKWQIRLVAVACWLVTLALGIAFAALYEEYATLRDGRTVTATVVSVAPYSKKHVRAELQYDGGTTTIWPTIEEAPAYTVGATTPVIVAGHRVIRASALADKRPSPLLAIGGAAALALGVWLWLLPRKAAKRRAARRDPLDVVIDGARRTRNVMAGTGVLLVVIGGLFALVPIADREATTGMIVGIEALAALCVITAAIVLRIAYRLRDPRNNELVELVEKRANEITWFYVLETRGKAGITVHDAMIWKTDGKHARIRLVAEDIDPLLAELARRAPHAARGYAEATERAYKADPTRPPKAA